PQPERPFEQYEWQDYMDQIDFFIKAPVLLVKEILPEMKKARWGKIINIVTEVADNCRTNFATYVAAKCGMAGLTKTWALEFGPWNIAVNSVSPGWIPTERHDDVADEEMEKYRAKVPMGRQGVPDDVAAAVSFFAAEENGFISGQRVSVNGANTF
ncbi:MAG: SDR family oxidoreductase, partial [Planctomycetes bacterium]|nr:SDR family oxidoreductase [Planctomycetota bacterium]